MGDGEQTNALKVIVFSVVWNNIQIQEISGTKQTNNKHRLSVTKDHLAFWKSPAEQSLRSFSF